MILKETARSTYMDVSKTDWEPTRFPGVWTKKLYEEPSGRMTTLTKMEPGARLPSHRHVGIEQSFVLEGTLVDDDGEHERPLQDKALLDAHMAVAGKATLVDDDGACTAG